MLLLIHTMRHSSSGRATALSTFCPEGGSYSNGPPTTRSSLASAGLFPKSVCRSPALIVFVCVPGVALVTSTRIVQPPAGIVAPLAYVIVVAPAAAVTDASVHVPPNPFGVSITTPAGKLSTRSALSVAATPFVFPNVIVSWLVPPDAIVPGLNA